MSLFKAPGNYSEMLNKISLYTFIGSLVCVAMVGYASISASMFMARLDIPVDVLGIKGIPLAYLIVALGVAVIFRAVRLHDKISDLFAIRERFDIQEILIPLAGSAGIPAPLAFMNCLRQRRHELMYRVFYKYASSTGPMIDHHLIIMALDKWSWFWIIIELIVVGLISAGFLVALASYKVAAWLSVVLLVATFFAILVNRICASAAHRQVTAIVEEPGRRREIKEAFDALCSQGS